MKSFKVYVTQRIPIDGIKVLEKVAKVIGGKTKLPPSRQEIIRNIRECDGILSFLTDKMDVEAMESAPKLKVISNYAVGYDNIDTKAATERKIFVTNTPGVLTETTADLAWSLLMAAGRRIVEADQYTRVGKWKTWEAELLLGQDIHHATLGIYGMGRIGSEMARRGHGFSMRILYHDQTRNKEVEKKFGAKYVNFETLLRESDFLSLHCPLTSETRHLISQKELSKMKHTAILINTARGAVVHQTALYQALKNKRIAGAGLDVFEKEPIDSQNPLLQLDNVVVLPHIGSASVKTRTKMAIMAASNLTSVLQGRKPENWVNKF
jgi:glyoxylate reductase